MNRDASLMISRSRSTASRATKSSMKLSRVFPATISRMLSIDVEIRSILSARLGCTSKHFDNVVGDPSSEARRKSSSHGSLRMQSSGVPYDMLDTDKVEKRE